MWLALTAWGTIAALFVLRGALALWRPICCLMGHHRETVRDCVVYTTLPNPYGYSIVMHEGMEWECCNCFHRRQLAASLTPTPSRRYAVLRRPKGSRA
jgi:hypothetical protein